MNHHAFRICSKVFFRVDSWILEFLQPTVKQIQQIGFLEPLFPGVIPLRFSADYVDGTRCV